MKRITYYLNIICDVLLAFTTIEMLPFIFLSNLLGIIFLLLVVGVLVLQLVWVVFDHKSFIESYSSHILLIVITLYTGFMCGKIYGENMTTSLFIYCQTNYCLLSFSLILSIINMILFHRKCQKRKIL